MKQLLIACITLITAMGCQPELTFAPEDYTPKVVVDGSIENGRLPRVYLTLSAPFTGANDSVSLSKQLITTAKVEVISNSTSEVLVLRRNNNEFPPVYYEASRLKGQAGQSYQLIIIYRGDTISATTSIPQPQALEKAWLRPNTDNDTLATLQVKWNDNPEMTDYYRFYTSLSDAARSYRAAWFANYSDRYFNGETVEMPLLKGKDNPLSPDEEYYFNKKDTVRVKFCTIDMEAYDFWQSFDNEVANGRNPFASSNKQVKHNIIGGIGIWFGIGASYTTAVIQP